MNEHEKYRLLLPLIEALFDTPFAFQGFQAFQTQPDWKQVANYLPIGAPLAVMHSSLAQELVRRGMYNARSFAVLSSIIQTDKALSGAITRTDKHDAILKVAGEFGVLPGVLSELGLDEDTQAQLMAEATAAPLRVVG